MTARAITLGDDWGDGATVEQKASARAMVERWRPVLFLQGFTIHILCSAEPCDGEELVNAEVRWNLEYHAGTITIYPKFWDELISDTERSFFLLHEMCHLISHKQKQLATDAVNEVNVRRAEIINANESATDWIAKVVWHLAHPHAGETNGSETPATVSNSD